MQLLNEALKPYSERQNDRKSLLLNEYTLNLTSTFTTKLFPNFAADDSKQRHSFLDRDDRILPSNTVSTSITFPRRRRRMGFVHSNEQACSELNRELVICEAANVDMKTKLSGQVGVFGAYINKVLFNQVEGRRELKSNGKMDVFTRLYQQAPARYKVNKRQANVMGIVSRLKQLFSSKDSQEQPSTPLIDTPARKKVVLSSKIKSICKEFSEQQLRNMVVPQSEILKVMAKWRV